MPRVLCPKLRTITVIFKRLQGFPFVSYLYLLFICMMAMIDTFIILYLSGGRNQLSKNHPLTLSEHMIAL